MNIKPVLVLAALSTLGACANYTEITTPPVTPKIKHASVNERVLGFSDFDLRTVDAKDSQKEIVGATCTLDSAELSARVTTPARIHMPQLKGKPTALKIACTAGSSKGALSLEPHLTGTAVGGPSAAGLVAAIVTSAIVASQDKWSYGGGAGIPALVKMTGPEAAK
jgi:hypothetical protein